MRWSPNSSRQRQTTTKSARRSLTEGPRHHKQSEIWSRVSIPVERRRRINAASIGLLVISVCALTPPTDVRRRVLSVEFVVSALLVQPRGVGAFRIFRRGAGRTFGLTHRRAFAANHVVVNGAGPLLFSLLEDFEHLLVSGLFVLGDGTAESE